MIVLCAWKCKSCGNIFSNDVNALWCPNCRGNNILKQKVGNENETLYN